MSYERQLIDANCNDCKFMARDLEKHKSSVEFHYKMALEEFEREKKRLRDLAWNWLREKGDAWKYQVLMNEHDKMKFQFDKKSALINFGACSKFNKPVSFIPETCQIETQNCFEHRRSLLRDI